jgi:hypothetical protein
LATLLFALTGAGYSESFGNGELSWANASRGWLIAGAFAEIGSGGGTIVGWPVSITTGSGHLSGALAAPASYANVEEIVLSRCSMCHSAEPVWATIVTAPRGILLDDSDHIRRNARLIGRNAAWSSAMPPGNVTEITGEERAQIAAWLAAEK